MIVTGKVSNTKIGFTIRFSNPKTIATITEVVKLSTFTPGKNLAITTTKTAVIKILINKFIVKFLS